MAKDTKKAGSDDGKAAPPAGAAKAPKSKSASGTTSQAKGGLAKPVTPSK